MIQLFNKPIEDIVKYQCLSPYVGPNGVFRCGKCDNCKTSKLIAWQSKLLLEASQHDFNGLFVTLTYNNDHLPEGGNVVKRDLQLFMKRLRRRYEYHYDIKGIRYFAVGEYGDRRGRPHYHLILFGLDKGRAKEIIDSCWTFGFNYTVPLMGKRGVQDAFQRIKYVSAYVAKKFHSIRSKAENRDLEPEFVLYSRKPALGYNGFKKVVTKILSENKLIPITGLSKDQRIILANHVLQDESYRLWNGSFKFKGYTVVTPKKVLVELTQKLRSDVLGLLKLNMKLMMNDWDYTYGEFSEREDLINDSQKAKVEYAQKTGYRDTHYKEKAKKVAQLYRAGKVSEHAHEETQEWVREYKEPEVIEFEVKPSDFDNISFAEPEPEIKRASRPNVPIYKPTEESDMSGTG